jgi:hypothetical protein
MKPEEFDVDITKNIRVVEWLKVEIVSNMGNLLRAILKGSEELIVNSLANGIVLIYILGKRLGFNFAHIDIEIENKLKNHIEENHELEKWYGDLSSFLRYWESRKR